MVFLDNSDRIQEFTLEEVEILNKKHNENEVYELFLDAMAEGIYQEKIASLKLVFICFPIEEEHIELLFWNNFKSCFKETIKWSVYTEVYKEAAARGTQIKSMLGLKDSTPITSKQLKNMKNNYVKLTGQDNYMQHFLNSITDFDAAAKWLSDNSFSLGGAMNLLDYDFLKHPKGKKGL